MFAALCAFYTPGLLQFESEIALIHVRFFRGAGNLSLTPIDKKATRRSSERAASTYDEHAVLEHEIESRLLERLDHLQQAPGMIADIGCGTGNAGRKLGLRFEHAGVVALDWSTAMLRELCKSSTPAQLPLCADMHALPLAARSVDLIFSNLALQWSYDLCAVFNEFRRIMKPGAMLVFTCYGPDTLYELRQAWRSVDEQPHVHDFPDMHDIGDELMSAGFREPVMDVERMTLEYPDVMALMRELKASGAHNTAMQRRRVLTGKSRLRAMQQAYEQFRRNDRYPASYEIIYGAAFAPAEGQPVRTTDGDVATFSIDALRLR
jgi:malonyl-CoA O-methyltransferase